MQIATILVKSLDWKLIHRFDSEFESAWRFQNNDTELLLYYDPMEGMYLQTNDDTFDLQALFDKIIGILKN